MTQRINAHTIRTQFQCFSWPSRRCKKTPSHTQTRQGAVTVHMKQIISKLTSKATHVRRSVHQAVAVCTAPMCTHLNRHHESFSHCAYAHTPAIYTPACAYDGKNLLRLFHRRKVKARDANISCACAIAKEAWYQISRGKNGASATRGSS